MIRCSFSKIDVERMVSLVRVSCFYYGTLFSAYRLRHLPAIGKQEINCAPLEFARVIPPSGQTCAQFLQPFVNLAGGYLANPDATNSCDYCAFRTSDQLLASSFNIFYDHRWRDVGILCAFVIFNVRLVQFSLTHL